MASALLSLARNEPVRRVAMTGEMTLTGEVFPVGGIQEKVIAARRAGIRELILPADNQPAFAQIPEHIRRGLKVHFVSRFTEVAALLFPRRRGRAKAG